MTPIQTQVLSHRTGQLIPVTLTVQLPAVWPSEHAAAVARLSAFGVPVRLEKKEGVPCLSLDASDVARSTVAAFFGVALKPKAGVSVGLETESHAALLACQRQALAPFEAQRTTYRAALEAEREAAPKRYFYEYGISYGDYSSEAIAQVVVLRPQTALERLVWTPTKPGQWVRHAILASEVAATLRRLSPDVLELDSRPVVQQQQLPSQYALREVSADEAALLVREAARDAQQQREQQETLAAEKEAAHVREAEEKQAQRARVEAQELFVWDEGVTYSSAGNQMLHSLGARVSEKDNRVSVYTTGSARDIAGASTTYSLREKLLAAGYVFDAPSKEWRTAYSLQNVENTLDFLRQHDTKAWPEALGMARCWECGCYSRHLDSDGYCGC